MANFIGLVFATLKNEGVDTKGMSTDEAIKKYNELKGDKGGTPAEQRKMKQPKNKHIDHDKFDEVEKWYVERHQDDKLGVKGFKEAREYINELANAGLSYDEIDEKIFEKTTMMDYEYDKLYDKKDKTEKDFDRMKYLREYGSGYKTANGQFWKVWKK